MMLYRSDWPETGASGPWSPVGELSPLRSDGTEWGVSSEDETGGSTMEVRAVQNGFETSLYRIPCWELRIQLSSSGDTSALLCNDAWRERIRKCMPAVEARFSDEPAYVYSKVMAAEPIHKELLSEGFEGVEHRCLFKSWSGDLSVGAAESGESRIEYTSLAQVHQELHGKFQDQILDVCREAFSDGYSRHFHDSCLARRVAGLDYILAVMRLNFDKVPPEGFLVAIDHETGMLAGFSVLGKKPAMERQTYTELLSAVRASYRGRGIYRGMTPCLSRSIPENAALLNVTHRQNEPMRRAYHASGRRHLGDTVIVRRVFGDVDSPG